MVCEHCSMRFKASKLIKETGGKYSNPAQAIQDKANYLPGLITMRAFNPLIKSDILIDKNAVSVSYAINGPCAENDIPLERCPNCGYLQSWMQKRWADKYTDFVAWPISFAINIPFWQIGLPARSAGKWWIIGAIAAYVAAFIVTYYSLSKIFCWRIIRPNKLWHKKNGFANPAPKIPAVSFETPSEADIRVPF